MCLSTFGLYEIYWFYRQWKSFNTANDLKHGNFTLWIYSLFAPLSSYSLFKHISNNVKETNDGKGLEAGGLAIVYFFFTRFWLGFLPLIPVQKKINLYWEKKYSNKLVRSNFGVWNWIVVGTVALIVVYAIFSEDTSTNTTSTTPVDTSVVEGYNQDEVASSVVNIFCPSTVTGEESTGGSGTIITEEGVILTNSHIIPQDKNNLHVDNTGCMVVLPDPNTGQPKEIYLAHPIVIPDLSDQYDLAYVSIYSAYYDEDEQKYAGVYPRKFPAFDDTTRCTNENVKLGESVRIFGYPAISGGYTLTVTDGLVSSFPGDGLIVTSAKISYGNSGGLAVDKNGCMVGVPSLVSSDENESLGVIYSMDLVNKFSTDVSNYLDNNK
ncbi:hypothetical protein A2774_01995 [Candidatus Roizmanbacteria bacterium RIFCSPHIGHO2_01_FULL_39_12c]|uniref:Serine protease n=1 Tax=Candidatus Roizmanbacteria bacterium RIFCSPHIGHO2_01_FULL_39_12c TaxID=1802031 RepID=A0A1F7GGQ5_9BACT|nr:MAG: hypothetical protein A2774_01995 [Candidatus Roizmanbacteria bacterium RIFCSPHIGHO2_01_FULL_39_12c]OGK47219.1 MAG: hypothetical protein A2963_04095 [Candidatus Roizmanbacteria bacterium RIFCSPLOWO2_01_FULL_40_13]